MNLQEYEEALNKLSPEELKKFNDDFGGGQKNADQRVNEFIHDSKHEPRICQLLGLKTEAEKHTDAVVRSANAAEQSAKASEQSAKASKLSTIFAGIACLVAIIALVVNILK